MATNKRKHHHIEAVDNDEVASAAAAAADDVEKASPAEKKQRQRPSWNTWVQSLIAYKSNHGNCTVPKTYKEDGANGLALGEWIKYNRSHQTQLSQERRDELSAIGFDWETRKEKDDRQWHEMLGRLKFYTNQHGNTRVPGRYTEDPQLGKFVSQQRQLYKSGRLLPARQAKLNAIQFEWQLQVQKQPQDTSRNDQQWLEHYQKLIAFQIENGHCLVSKSYESDKSLGNWCVFCLYCIAMDSKK